nr:MAG TPA: hypothetical protein [Caudoviricetes sp.]DAU83656.1 MAG TPA: hypothetical protein [Caudoviricetes sp.]DAZ34030.1 MAG TPA: hypothetical protein [Caudoviricetes sp.]DAZ46055.1 MAG TPA: hypothetical protein [Caudoviricetes sp.]
MTATIIAVAPLIRETNTASLIKPPFMVWTRNLVE